MARCSDKERDEEEADYDGPETKSSKGERHVSFPPDEKMVSGFAEYTDRHGRHFFALNFFFCCFYCHPFKLRLLFTRMHLVFKMHVL